MFKLIKCTHNVFSKIPNFRGCLLHQHSCLICELLYMHFYHQQISYNIPLNQVMIIIYRNHCLFLFLS
ncbi:hypothetical protein HanXRQr2_Chr03g0098131 [Helianthus annuus]|uniref:Uncharacterized protein n=1 Tax=Helianthus annuus TaxID=4232 RepID=A0A9K3JDF6_HELAN|nr:hypothetical protein HanXRQr2_Chr03g0098131 [Helianthus annuus]